METRKTEREEEILQLVTFHVGDEEFGVEIPDAEADKILSTGEAISYLAAHPQAK